MAAVVQASANAVTATTDALSLLHEFRQMLRDSHDMELIHACMSRGIKLLCALKEDYQNQIQRHVTKISSRTHIEWVRSVGQIESQLKELASTYVDESKKQADLHSYSRARLTEEMRKKCLDIQDLLEQGHQIEARILVDKEAEPVVKMVTAPCITKFPTLQNSLHDILHSLGNDKIKVIEVRGIVGCGKTTIMQNLNNHEKVSEMFDIVIWVKVSTEDEGREQKNSSIEHLQKVIIQRLKLVMDGVDQVDEVARIIAKDLKSRKYLMLLDDVKEDLYLDQVGILFRDANVKSKIVLATRTSNTRISLHSAVDKLIKIPKLTEAEAWQLFKTIVDGSEHMNERQLKQDRKKVIKLCDGLPLMIKMVAHCFRMCETKEDWSVEFRKLKYWPSKGDVAMQELEVLLEFCRGRLSDVQENCYFYSALYHEDSEIYVGGLLDNWWGANLLGDSDDANATARDMLRHLKKTLFLEEGMIKEHVRMQKWIRRAALYNMRTSENHSHLVRTSEALQHAPKEKDWRQKQWISLVDNRLHTLPDKPDCSELSTLFLQENLNLQEIPDTFFECMKNLRVLGLHSTGIASLPSSLSNLITLKVLNLNSCIRLVQFPSEVAKLENLEVLDIRGSGLKIPPQIQSLMRLRRLLASFTSADQTNTQAGLISQILTLKELIIDIRFSRKRWEEMVNDVLKILVTLKKLTNLQVCIDDEEIDVIKMVDNAFKISAPKADHLNSFVKSRNEIDATSFLLFVGCSIAEDPQIQEIDEYQRYVKYCKGEINEDPTCMLLQEADALEIVKHIDLKCLSDFGDQTLSRIRGCLVEKCPKIQTILDGRSTLILSNLERLYLNDLPELVNIWGGTIQILPELETLDVRNCPLVIEVFPRRIQEANQPSTNGIMRSCVFPKLENFILIDMPNLTSVYVDDWLEWPSLENVRIRNCKKLLRVLFNNENATKLSADHLKINPEILAQPKI